MHASLTADRIARAVERAQRAEDGPAAFPGFCIACGRKAKQNVEPDAREYPCQFKTCGARAVYGAEELLFMVAR